MVFSSTIFLVYFFPFFLLFYYLADKKYKNYVALIASIFFYAWGAPKFIFVVIASIFADFYIVKEMFKSQNPKHKKLWVSISVALNIGLLVYFKYSNFFVENFNVILQAIGFKAVHFTKLVLPIGISFFTFQKFTYAIDVYRGKYQPLEKLTDLCLYILLFPQLIAGPIVRYSEIADQLVDREKYENIDNKLIGFYRFVIGLAKKVLIANVVGAEADRIFSMDPQTMNSGLAWLGLMAYTFQIYFDFSGYSDMAIGIGRMIGFKFPENFNSPYVSQSITEFWRRWHITLGRWMRDYLYIPLGGNRVNTKFRLYFNLWFVFLVSGLWHGANWTFVIWGAYHGLFLILDRLFLVRLLEKTSKVLRIILTFFIASLGWVLFRSETLKYALSFYKKLFEFKFSGIGYVDPEVITIMIVAAIFAFFVSVKPGEKIMEKVFFDNYTLKRHLVMSTIVFLLFVISLASIVSSGFNPFIYFRF